MIGLCSFTNFRLRNSSTEVVLGSIMFHVRKRPADYHPRKRKKKPQSGKWSKEMDGRYDDTLDRLPFFTELTPDGREVAAVEPQRYRLFPNVTEVGSERPLNGHPGAAQSQCLTLHGPSVMPRHCVVAHTDGIVTVTPCSRDAETYVNGVRIFETTILSNGSTVKFGRHHTFRFIDPDPQRQRLAERTPTDDSVSPSAILNNTCGISGGGSTQNYETTFDVDGNVETVSTSSLGNKDETRSQRSVCSSRDGNRYTRGDAILPAVLEFSEESEDAFLHAIITNLDPNAVGLKLAPTYTLYLAARYRASTHYQPDLSPTERAQRLTFLLARVAAMIQNVIQERYLDPLSLAFWMANASELLHFLKSDRHVSAFSLDAQDILAEAVQMAFRNLVSCLQGELAGVVPSFMSERDDPQDGESSPVLQVLTNTMSLLRCCRVNAALTIQLFSQLFHFVNMWAFNTVVTSQSPCYCSRAWGLRFKSRLAEIEAWAESQGLELAADCHLARIIQAAHLLLSPKVTPDDFNSISSTCFKLNSLQLRALLTKYQPGPDEPRLSPELVEHVVRVAENVADELARTDGREVHLTEDPVLQLPFLLPDDGYSSAVVRGVPQGLVDFLAPFTQAGFCRMTAQPTASGSWQVYQMQEAHPGARSPSAMSNRSGGGGGYHQQLHQQPEFQVIKLHKSNNGMGLSIVAAKGAGQDRLGIYIKSVVKGGAADQDGQLQAGDQLLKVDGQSLIGITQEKAAEYLVRTGPVVTLEVAKQGAIYHGLATLLSQPSPIMGRGRSGSLVGVPRHLLDVPPPSPRRRLSLGDVDTAVSRNSRTPTSRYGQFLSPNDIPDFVPRTDAMHTERTVQASRPASPLADIGYVEDGDDYGLAEDDDDRSIGPYLLWPVLNIPAEAGGELTIDELPLGDLDLPVRYHVRCRLHPREGQLCACEERAEALRAPMRAPMRSPTRAPLRPLVTQPQAQPQAQPPRSLAPGRPVASPTASANKTPNWKSEVIRLHREKTEREQRLKQQQLEEQQHNSQQGELHSSCSETTSTCSTAEVSDNHAAEERNERESRVEDRLDSAEAIGVWRDIEDLVRSVDRRVNDPEDDSGDAARPRSGDPREWGGTDLRDEGSPTPPIPRRRHWPPRHPLASCSDRHSDLLMSALNLDLSRLRDNDNDGGDEGGDTASEGSYSPHEEVSPREKMFGCGRVAALTRYYSRLDHSHHRLSRRWSSSEPDISPRRARRADNVTYSIGLKAVGYTVHPEVDECASPPRSRPSSVTSPPASSFSLAASDSPLQRLRRVRRLLEEEVADEHNNDPRPQSIAGLSAADTAEMWARVKKLLKGGADDEGAATNTASAASGSNASAASRPRAREEAAVCSKCGAASHQQASGTAGGAKKKRSLQMLVTDSSRSADLARRGSMKARSESCLVSSHEREQAGEPHPHFSMLTGQRCQSEEALLVCRRKPKRKVAFNCLRDAVKEFSESERSPAVRRYAVSKPIFPAASAEDVTRVASAPAKFPDAYIRTKSSRSAEDLSRAVRPTPAPFPLRRELQCVSMPHIAVPAPPCLHSHAQHAHLAHHLHPYLLAAHRASSDEVVCCQRHLAQHSWPRRMSERDLPSRVLSENHNTSTLNGGRNLPAHAPIHSSKSVPSLNTGSHADSAGHGPMGPMSPISPILGPTGPNFPGRPPHHEVFNPGYSRTSSTTSIPQGLRSRSSQNLSDPRSPPGPAMPAMAVMPPMGMGSRQMSNPSLQHSPNGHTAGPDGERFYQNLSVYRNQDTHNGHPPQVRGKMPSPQHPSQQDRSIQQLQKGVQNMQSLRGSQSSLHRDRPASAYLPQNSAHAQVIPGMAGMQARSQSSRDMVRQDAKLAEMQEEVRRRELRLQQPQHPRVQQMIGPLSPQQRLQGQGYPPTGAPPPTAPKPGARPPSGDGPAPQRPPPPNEDRGFRDSPPPPPPPTSTHPLYKPAPPVDTRYNATSEGAPRGTFYPASVSQPGRHIQFNTATNPWDREEKEREQIRRREAARQWRDQQIAELSAVPIPTRTPQQEEQLRTLRLEREFQRRAEEAARQEDEEEDDQESPERSQGLLRLAQPPQQQQQQLSPQSAPSQPSPQIPLQHHPSPQQLQQTQQRPYNQQNGIIGRTSVPPSINNEEKERLRRLEEMKRKQAEMEREREQQAEERLRESQKQRREEEIRQQQQTQFQQQRIPNHAILSSPTKNNVQFNNNINNNNINQPNNLTRSGQYTSPLSGKHPAASHLRLDNLVMNGPSAPHTPPQGYQQYNGFPNNTNYNHVNQNYQTDSASPVLQSGGPQQRLDTLLHGPMSSEKTAQAQALPPQPPERGSSHSVMMSQPNTNRPPPSGPLSPSAGGGGLQRSCLVSTPGDQPTNSTKRVSFHDPGSSQPPPPPASQPPPIREDPNHFINEAETMLASPKTPDGTGNLFVGSTPGVIGAQEVYRDPRQRRLAEQQQQQQKQQTARVPEKLTFKEKMKMFAMETGEDGTPRDKVKISRAQRDIDTIASPTTHSS